jgi:hypothetical protein
MFLVINFGVETQPTLRNTSQQIGGWGRMPLDLLSQTTVKQKKRKAMWCNGDSSYVSPSPHKVQKNEITSNLYHLCTLGPTKNVRSM